MLFKVKTKLCIKIKNLIKIKNNNKKNIIQNYKLNVTVVRIYLYKQNVNIKFVNHAIHNKDATYVKLKNIIK